MNLSTTEIAHALEIKPKGGAADFSLVTSDTRTIAPGSLFVALKGEARDGHDFILDAIKKGATGVVCSKAPGATGNSTIFQVDDTLAAFRTIARLWRSKISFPIVAVCGSAGKTTSKEFLAAILRARWPHVLKTEASQNGFTGIPTTLLRLRGTEGAAVIEVGIDEIGAMVQHLEIVQPSAGLLTSIGAEHLEKLIDVETVAREEAELFRDLEARQGFICVNADDEKILAAGKAITSPHKCYYTLKSTAPKKDAPCIFGEYTGTELKVSFPNKQQTIFAMPLEGTHNALNLLGALTMAFTLGLTPEQMQAGLKTFTPPQGRSEIHDWKGAKIYADFYNANPLSVEAAVKTIAHDYQPEKIWLCLGDMLELGTEENELHRALSEPIRAHKISHVLLYGTRMQHLTEELKKDPNTIARHFETQEALADFLAQQLKPGDRALIKGSRGTRMERVWERLKSRA